MNSHESFFVFCRWQIWSCWSWMSWTVWSRACCTLTLWVLMVILNATTSKTHLIHRTASRDPAVLTTFSPCCWSTLAQASAFWLWTPRTTTSVWQAPGQHRWATLHHVLKHYEDLLVLFRTTCVGTLQMICLVDVYCN